MAEINVELSRILNSKCQRSCLGPNFSASKLAIPCIRHSLILCLGTIASFTGHKCKINPEIWFSMWRIKHLLYVKCGGGSTWEAARMSPEYFWMSAGHHVRKYFLVGNHHFRAKYSSSCGVVSPLVLNTLRPPNSIILETKDEPWHSGPVGGKKKKHIYIYGQDRCAIFEQYQI